MDTNDVVKKQTVYLIVIIALIVGFLCGVLYSVYRAPANTGATHPHPKSDRAHILAALEQATREHPDDAKVWAELGHAYSDTGQTEKAIQVYTRALELRPGDADIMTDLGVMYHENQQHESAIALFEEVLQKHPDHLQARFNKGVVLLVGLNKPDETIVEWKTLLRYHPEASASSGRSVRELIKQLEEMKQ